MQVDQTTLKDIAIFNNEEEASVFHYLNHTVTLQGKAWLQTILENPLKNITEISDTQNTIKYLAQVQKQLPQSITNGTLMVIERFYDTPLNSYPQHANALNSFMYKTFCSADYALTNYSLQHFKTFITTFNCIVNLLNNSSCNKIKLWCDSAGMLLNKPIVQQLINETGDAKQFSVKKTLHYAQFLKFKYKLDCLALIEIYSKIDAYQSLAIAKSKYNLCFPNFVETSNTFVAAKNLFHMLLQKPVACDVELNEQKNFLFLTGANMAGKSTFIKALGIAVYLAHLGMAVPAASMSLSYFDGLLSNIQVLDNILKNESYFFNEVQRIKKTVEKINNNNKWLILIDELFKGTNMQDAMKCSSVVIEGLQKKRHAVFVLSTHLYEIGEALQKHSNIFFKHFETRINNNELEFSYVLKDGISSDRLGYLILEREGVVELLTK